MGEPVTDIFNRTISISDVASNETEQHSNIAPFNELALKVTYISIGAVGLIGNILVVVVILNNSNMRKKLTSLYLINQSLIDMTAAFFILFLGIFEHDGTNMTSGDAADEFICSIWLTRAPLWSMLMSSTWNLLLLTVERYWEIVHPIAHKTKFTKNKAMIGIVFVWIFGPFYNLAYEVPTSKIIRGDCYPFSIWPSYTIQTLVGVFTILLQYVIPIVVMAFCYSKMALALRVKVSPAPADVNSIQTTQHNRYERARRNIIKTLFIVSVCFMLCWTWNEVFIFLYFIGYPTDFGGPFYHFTVVAVFVNCCVNPFVYTAKYEEFQKGLRRLVCQKILHRPEAGLNNVSVTGHSIVAA